MKSTKVWVLSGEEVISKALLENGEIESFLWRFFKKENCEIGGK
jgi:hypothetical protein